MMHLPLELVEIIVFRLDDFYTYVALGYKRSLYADTLMWMNGGPGVVLTNTLSHLASSSSGKAAIGGNSRGSVDSLRVLNFLRTRYGSHLSAGIALSKAIQTMDPVLVRYVSMVWNTATSDNNGSDVMALMAAASFNFWWAVQFLIDSSDSHLPRALPHSVLPQTSLERRRLELRQRILNISHLLQGQLDLINYRVRKPLRCISLLFHHPDPKHLSKVLTDDIFWSVHHRQWHNKHLICLAAHLGKHAFLRKVLTPMQRDHDRHQHTRGVNSLPVTRNRHPVIFDRSGLGDILRAAAQGINPKMAAKLFVEFSIFNLYASWDILWDYRGRAEFIDEIEAVARIMSERADNYNDHDNRNGNGGARQQQQHKEPPLEVILARDDIKALKRYLQRRPSANLDVLNLLIYRDKLHLLPPLVNFTPTKLQARVEESVARKEEEGSTGGVKMDVDQEGNRSTNNDNIEKEGGFIPQSLFKRFEARIVSTLMTRSPDRFKEIYEQRLGMPPLVPNTPLTLEVFSSVSLDEKVKMLRQGFVTDQRDIQMRSGVSAYYAQTFQHWTRFLQLAPFFATPREMEDDKCDGEGVEDDDDERATMSDNSYRKIGTRSDENATPREVAKALRKRGMFQAHLPIRMTITTHGNDGDGGAEWRRNGEGDDLSWKELIDWVMFDTPNSILSECNDVEAASRFGTHMYFTCECRGPWCCSTEVAIPAFKTFEKVASSTATFVPSTSNGTTAIASSSSLPSQPFLTGRTIAYLNTSMPVDVLLGGRWVEWFRSWHQSLDPTLYCRFLACKL